MDNQNSTQKSEKNKKPDYATAKPILVKILQWFYILLALISIVAIFLFPQASFIRSLGFASEIIVAIFVAISLYSLILAFSFFTQNGNLLILSLVSIFFTTIGALLLLIVSLPNAHNFLGGDLPECASKLATCSLSEGIIVASAMLLVVAIPALVINFITIIGAVKAIAATD